MFDQETLQKLWHTAKPFYAPPSFNAVLPPGWLLCKSCWLCGPNSFAEVHSTIKCPAGRYVEAPSRLDGDRASSLLRVSLLRVLTDSVFLRCLYRWRVAACAGGAFYRGAHLARKSTLLFVMRVALLQQRRNSCARALQEWACQLRIHEASLLASAEWQQRLQKMRKEKSQAEALKTKGDRELSAARERISLLEMQLKEAKHNLVAQNIDMR